MADGAGGRTVGRVGVRAVPDLASFRRDLQTELDRIERSANLVLNVDADTSPARKQVERLAQDVARISTGIGVDVDDKHAQSKLKDLSQDRTTTVNADADTDKAFTDLERLTRPRTVDLILHVSGSGARGAMDPLRKIGTALTHFDMAITRVTAVTMAVGSLGAVAAAASRGVASMSLGLFQVARGAVTLPALLGGAVAATASLVVAWKNAGTELANVRSSFQALGRSMSGAYWDQARRPIVQLVSSLLPTLRTGLVGTSRDMGALTAQLARGFTTIGARQDLVQIFTGLRQGIERATPGVSTLTGAFTTLGAVGSRYMGQLGSAIGDSARRFSDWVQQSAQTGRFDEWIQTAIGQWHALESAVGSAGRIVAGLARPLVQTGGGMRGVATAMGQVADAVNSPAFQLGLDEVFSGAEQGARGLRTALSPVAAMFERLAPRIGNAFSQVGSATGDVLGSIAGALAQTGPGITDFISGLAGGARNATSPLKNMGGFLSDILSLGGQVASTVGTVLGAALESLVPAIKPVVDALKPLVQALGKQLAKSIKDVSPGLKTIGDLVANLLKVASNHPEALLVVAGGVATFVGAFKGLSAIGTATKGLRDFGKAAKDLKGLMVAHGLSDWIKAGPFVALAAAIVIAVGALVWFFTQTKTGKRVWGEFTTWLGQVGGRMAASGRGIARTWSNLWNGLGRVVSSWGRGITTNVPHWLGQVGSRMRASGQGIAHWWSGMWNGLGSFVSHTWSSIRGAVSRRFTALWGDLRHTGSTISGWWGRLWAGVGSTSSNRWNAIRGAVGRRFRGLSSDVHNIGNSLGHWLSGLWSGIGSTAGSRWHSIATTVSRWASTTRRNVTNAFNGLRRGVSSAMNGVRSAAATPINWVISHVYNNGLRRFVNSVFSHLGMRTRLPSIGTIRLATGGTVPGSGRGDHIPALLEPGEFVVNRRATEAFAPLLAQINGGWGAYQRGGVAHYAAGGVVGDLKNIATHITDFVVNAEAAVGKWISTPVRSMLSQIPGSGAFVQMGTQAMNVILRDLPSSMAKALGSVVGNVAAKVVAGAKLVVHWTGTVVRALMLNHLAPTPQAVNATLRRMNQESGGNPNAVNRWDINAREGHPSMGLMQVIAPTFQANHVAGTSNNILDPLANVAAAINYAHHRYGSIYAAFNRAGGYDTGGLLMPGTSVVWNGTGQPEEVFNPQQSKLLRQELAAGPRVQVIQNQQIYATDPYVAATQIGRDVKRELSTRGVTLGG